MSAVLSSTLAGAQGPALRLVPAVPVTSARSEVVTGALSPSRLLPLGFEVGGRLAVSKVRRGEVVKAGQFLGQLDTEIVDAQVAAAEAGLAAAEAGAVLARDVAARNDKLKAEGSVADIAQKQSEAQARQAAAQVALARAQLSQAQAARKRHSLSALFAGTVVDAPDNVGGMVGPGNPVFVIMALDPLLLKATVPEAAWGLLKVGTPVKVESVGSAAATNQAVVRVILPNADPQTRRLPIEVEVPNREGRFLANSLVRVTVPLGEAQAAVRIPSTALVSTGGAHVYAVDKQGLLKKVAVTVLERKPTEVVVAPAEPVTQVVDYPTGALVEGTKVTAR